ncbi:Hypothetical predicted protein [Olea europaea subsp. europaea]|uniref:Uncharacterized protein n=1 Tax=Olea europaea subsp. europaea TaxID=158383 RepID=A0A8S0QTG9_OLEEU|nr:Hypothetical predicted protein [Olea europaea subsp. europaea]
MFVVRLKLRFFVTSKEINIPFGNILFAGSSYMYLGTRTSLCISEHRPQPSWDRTCTAAAAMGLLYELHQLPEFSSFGFDKQAEALGDALEVLLEALTNRRLRMGRSITRKERHYSSLC